MAKAKLILWFNIPGLKAGVKIGFRPIVTIFKEITGERRIFALRSGTYTPDQDPAHSFVVINGEITGKKFFLPRALARGLEDSRSTGFTR